MDRRERALIAAALAALAVLPIAVFLLWRDDGEERPAAVTHGCSAEEKATEARLAATPTPTPMGPNLDYEEMNRQGAPQLRSPTSASSAGSRSLRGRTRRNRIRTAVARQLVVTAMTPR